MCAPRARGGGTAPGLRRGGPTLRSSRQRDEEHCDASARGHVHGSRASARRADGAAPARDDGLAYRRRLLPPLILGIRRGQAPTPDQVRGRLLSPLVAYVDPSAMRGEREEGRGADVWLMLLAMVLSDVVHRGERCWRLLRACWRDVGLAWPFTVTGLIPVPSAAWHKCGLPRVTGRVPTAGYPSQPGTGGRSLDNRPAGHTDRGAPVGIRSAAMGRLRPIFSARFKGS